MKQKEKAAPAKQPPNLSELARLHGVSREALRGWRDGGLNLADEQALRAKIAASRSPAAIDAATAPGLETYGEARRRRAVADADRSELEVARRRRELMDFATVVRVFSGHSAAVAAAIRRMPAELPDQLEGLSAAEINAVLVAYQADLFADISARVETALNAIAND